jgi:signal transduction histidine kinase/ActR/RegA family two-component response regulator
LADVLSQVPGGVVIAEAESGRLLVGNQEVEHIFRHPFRASASFANYSAWRGFHMDGQPFRPTDWPLSRALLNGDVIQGEEMKIQRGDGSTGIICSSARPLFDGNGRMIAGLWTFSDITEQKELAESLSHARDAAENASLAKAAFLNNMSHEMRTPLGVVMGYVDLLSTVRQSKDDRDLAMTAIRRNLDALAKLIDDILDISEFEAGRLSAQKAPFSVSSLVAEVFSLVKFRAQEKGLALNLKFATAVPSEVISDAPKIKQIVVSLVGNAIKFTEKGNIDLVLRYEKPNIVFEVSDTGVGISAQQCTHLFQPFMQADTSTTRAFGGSGIGLALARRLAHILGGDVELKSSNERTGSKFLVSIPVEETDRAVLMHEEQTVLKPLAKEAPVRLKGRRILLVDDSSDNRCLISRILEIEGASIETANDGAEGLSAALKGQHDLVLMDLQMPRMDGFSATEHLRACGFRQPILALTANAVREERERCLAVGCNDHMSKPVHRNDLVHKISSLLTENLIA